MPLVNGYYYPTLAEWNTSNGSGGSGSGTFVTGYVSGSAFQTGSAASPGIAIGQGAGLFQGAPNTVDIAVSGTSMIHVDPGSGPYLGVVQLSGPFYTDGTSPLLEFGSGSWGSGLLSFPNALRVRTADGYSDKQLIAGALYASGYISGSEDSIQTLAGSVQAGTGRAFHWWNSSRIQDVSNGVIMMTNMSTSSFSRLILGANSANSASLVAAGTTIKIRNGNDTADANLNMAGLNAATANVTVVSASQLAVAGNATIAGNATFFGTMSASILTASTVGSNAAAFGVVTAATGNFGFLNYTTSGAAGTFTDLTASSVTANKIVSPTFNKTAMGAFDAASAASGAYLSCEYMGDSPMLLSQLGSGFATNSCFTPGSVNTLPSGITTTIIANHPGFAITQVTAVNDIAAAMTNQHATSLYIGGTATPLTQHSFYHIFYTPQLTSSASERYTLSVGTLSATTTQIIGGFYLEYSDNINSGNWVLCENGNNNSGGRQVLINTSVPMSPGTWNKLSIQQNYTNITASLNGTYLGATSSILLKQSPYIICLAIGGMRLSKQTTTVSASITSLLDYSSLQSTLTR